VQKAADALAAEYGLTNEWHGNILHFHRAGVHGQIHVSEQEVRLDATLGLLLKPFRATFVRHIERDFDKYLPELKSAASARKLPTKAARTRA
jgi:putative polyhydroxyalkanoate system protein